MPTFLLLHGGWAGGWVWREVADQLVSQGHRVLTPTLTGFGERAHLLSPTITFDTLVTDILNTLVYEELQEVVLVAHSLSGPVAQAVATRAPERLSRLVLLDAFYVRPGERTVDAFEDAFTAGIQQWVDAAGEGWFVPPMDPPPDSIDAHEARGRHSAMPWRPFLEPVVLEGSGPGVPGTYVLCTEKEDTPVDRALVASAARARAQDWEYAEFPSGHVPMWTDAAVLARLLADLSRVEVAPAAPARE